VGADGAASAPPWFNWARNQEVHARNLVRPRNLNALLEVVQQVSERRGRLRAVATGLSFSDILQTDDTLVVLTDLTEDAPEGTLLPLEPELWREPGSAQPRVRILCGARIRQLNEALDGAGLAFPNLGGFDGQTFVGALSTSTHGSGAAIGPLCDLVLSLDLVAAFGRRYRIEPADGITDPTRFARRYGDGMTLVQDDDWFQAAVVSLGCMGVLYSVTCRVQAAYDLHERRRLDTWNNVRRAIRDGVEVSRVRHYEVEVNPYARRDGEHTCLVTERALARPGEARVPLPASRVAAERLTFLASTQQGIVELIREQPRLLPVILETGLDALRTDHRGHVDKSYRVFNVGKINDAEVLSGEYFMPLANDAFVRGIDRLLEVMRDNTRHGIYQTAPLSLRFVQGSPALLSMVHGRGVFGAVELAMFTEAVGAAEAVLSYEQALYGFGARPHWGQLHELTGARGWLRAAYPGLSRWQAVQRALDPHGSFDNHFTDRLGLSVGSEAPA